MFMYQSDELKCQKMLSIESVNYTAPLKKSTFYIISERRAGVSEEAADRSDSAGRPAGPGAPGIRNVAHRIRTNPGGQ